MLSIINIRTVAKYEIKTLLRSWFFRIFSLLTIVILFFFDLMIVTDVGPNPPWMFRAIPASIPYFNLLIFNLIQAIIIVFLASDFLKRDKKLDTTDVIYIRSMSNADYVFGKTAGILGVFLLLNFIILLLALIFNFAQTDTPVVWMAYVYYPLIISIPSLIFIIGLSFLFMVILKNQAITFLILLGYIAVTLFFDTHYYNYVLDYMAFKLPLMYSDFVGFGNLQEILIQRSIYLFSGLGFIFLTILMLKRLPQSITMTRVSVGLSIIFIALSVYSTWNYTSISSSTTRAKTEMIEINTELREENIVQINEYKLDLEHHGKEISATVAMHFSNDQDHAIDKLIFSLNPSLEVTEFSLNGIPMDFKQHLHVVQVATSTPIAPGSNGEIALKYHGVINDQLSYLDVDQETLDQNNTLAMMKIDKRHGFIEEDFVLLTPEILWYPIAGVTYSPENPTFHNKQFSRYTLNVKSKPGLKVISQGTKTKQTDGTVSFSESLPLPRISLTIGDYVEKSLMVDSVEFNLYFFSDHDYFSPYVNELDDTLASMISEIKQDYERELNLDYYYKNFSVVEVPIQFYSYARRWASYQEVVQPQIVFVPEKAASLRQADFKGSFRREKKRVDQGNQAMSDKEIQARILNRVLTGTFTSGFSGRGFGGNRGDQNAGARALSATSIYKTFPNYYSYIYYVKSGEWSVLNQAFESYLLGEAEDMRSLIQRRVGGLSSDENANQALKENSFEAILKSATDRELMDEVIKAKGNYLFALIQSKIGIENFDSFLSEILVAHKFKVLDISVFNKALKDRFDFDLEPYLDDWLKTKNIPGFLLSNMVAYEIRDGENTRYQVLFTISNKEDVDGLATISFRTMGGGGFGGRGGIPSLDLEKIIHLEPHQQMEVGIVLDAEPRLMAVNTLISQNIPSAISHFFSKIELKENMKPFEGAREVQTGNVHESEFEIIVDNEDKGFELIQPENESLLKNWLNIENDTGEQKYIGIRTNRPPQKWRATAQPEYYGKYVLSAYIIAKGTGDKKAIWNAEIKETGMHEIHYYIGKLPVRGRGRTGGGGRQRGQGGGQGGANQQQEKNYGSYHFTVFHDDGEDEVIIDVDKAEEGWNFLGTYYLSTGPAKVVLTNETDGKLVAADAVKWVRTQ